MKKWGKTETYQRNLHLSIFLPISSPVTADPEALPFVAFRGANEDRVSLMDDGGEHYHQAPGGYPQGGYPQGGCPQGGYQPYSGLQPSAPPPSSAVSVPGFRATDSPVSVGGKAESGRGVQWGDDFTPDSTVKYCTSIVIVI